MNMQYLMNKDGMVFDVVEHEEDYWRGSQPLHTFRCYALDGRRFDFLGQHCFNIKKVIYSDPATIVIWTDGTKTVVKCQEDDVYDEQTGLLMCIAKKAYGNNGKFNDILREWEPEEEIDIFQTLSNNLDDLYHAMINSLRGGKFIKVNKKVESEVENNKHDITIFDEYKPVDGPINGWIPCFERLPEKDGEYLVSLKLFRGDVLTATLKFFNGEWLSYPDDKVLAWMPLPEPYKAE